MNAKSRKARSVVCVFEGLIILFSVVESCAVVQVCRREGEGEENTILPLPQ